MKWLELSLGEALHVKHGYAFKGDFFTDNGQYIVLTPGNFNEEGGFRTRGEKDRTYSGNIPESYILDERDLIVAMTEQGPGLLGSSALVPESNRYLHNQRLGLIDKIDELKLDKHFLYYLFNTHDVRGQISGSASGTKVRHTAPERIYQVRVRIPVDVAYQRRVADILAAYDELIENNRRRMALLEDSGRLLYQEWFVRLRFPGHEHALVTDGIPEEWESKRIGDIADCIGGGTPSTNISAYWEDGSITWVTPTDVTRNKHFVLLDAEKAITDAGLQNSSTKLVPAHAVLMTSRASVGFFAVAGREVCTNQGFISVVAHDSVFSTFLLFHLSERVEEIRTMGSGSTYPEVSRGKFKEFHVLIPPRRLVMDFDEQASLLLRQIRVLKQQNHKLIAARDLLLPRLMNGEIAL